MKKLFILCAVCLLALTGCTKGQAEVTPTVRPTATPQATPLVSATELPEPTPVVAATPEVIPTPEVLPTETVLQPTPTPEPEGWDGDPDKLTLDDFPTQLATEEEIAAGSHELYLLAQLPEQDTWLYGVSGEERIILRVGERWKDFAVRYAAINFSFPELYYGDFDGDMDLELAIIPFIANGQDTSLYALHIVEFGDTGWTIQTLQDSDYRAIVEQSVMCRYDGATNIATLQLGDSSIDLDLSVLFEGAVPQGPVSSISGNHISFTVEADTITGHFSVALQGDGLPNALISLARVDATVVYTGSSFGLTDLGLRSLF